MPEADLSETIKGAVFRASEIHAAQQERLAERVAQSWLPRPLRRLVDHPRLLRVAYFIRPRWRPVIRVGHDLNTTVYTAQMKDGTVAVLRVETKVVQK